QGTLSLTNVQQLTTNWPEPAPGIFGIAVRTKVDGGNAKVVNGTAGNVGVWRFMNGSWFNLTGVVSNNRATVVGQAPFDVAPPNTPGPDDEYRGTFQRTDS